MLFFAIIRFRASANISLNLFLNIYLFWLLHLSQKFSILFYSIFLFFLFWIASCIKFWLFQLILYLKEYVLLCYAIFDINIAKNNWLLHLNQTLIFNDSFVLISELCIYSIRCCLFLHKISIFPNLLGRLDKGHFLPKFYNLLTKRATRG